METFSVFPISLPSLVMYSPSLLYSQILSSRSMIAAFRTESSISYSKKAFQQSKGGYGNHEERSRLLSMAVREQLSIVTAS